MLFGSELFEEYIGQLAMASMASLDIITEGEEFDAKKLQEKMRATEYALLTFSLVARRCFVSFSTCCAVRAVVGSAGDDSMHTQKIQGYLTEMVVQKEREEKLTEILKDRLNLYVQGNKEDFSNHAEGEVSRLSDAGPIIGAKAVEKKTMGWEERRLGSVGGFGNGNSCEEAVVTPLEWRLLVAEANGCLWLGRAWLFARAV
ncbi:unnamed protein product [Ilex paraguariensis]|uniref:Uncharacterized protein n=1 Tax=Ilex paraguariensis TaxID=185542 RepID=A0ABC8UQS5_9AQUA